MKSCQPNMERERVYMISISKLFEITKENAAMEAQKLEQGDIGFLVELLNEKDDRIRYPVLLLLQSRSVTNDDVYPFWDVFQSKMKCDNSYQRSIGLMLIAGNVRWDKHNKLDVMIGEYFALFHDDKPITIRQSIQALHSILPYKINLGWADSFGSDGNRHICYQGYYAQAGLDGYP
jgi:hypothetical protein